MFGNSSVDYPADYEYEISLLQHGTKVCCQVRLKGGGQLEEPLVELVQNRRVEVLWDSDAKDIANALYLTLHNKVGSGDTRLMALMEQLKP